MIAFVAPFVVTVSVTVFLVTAAAGFFAMPFVAGTFGDFVGVVLVNVIDFRVGVVFFAASDDVADVADNDDFSVDVDDLEIGLCKEQQMNN